MDYQLLRVFVIRSAYLYFAAKSELKRVFSEVDQDLLKADLVTN